MIDIVAIRNHFRSRIINAGIATSSEIAWQNRNFDPASRNFYIEEVVGIDGEYGEFMTVDAAELTMTYNIFVYADETGGSANVERAEQKRKAIVELFTPTTRSFALSGMTVQYIGVKRRTATRNGAWWLSPVDISIKATTDNPIVSVPVTNTKTRR